MPLLRGMKGGGSSSLSSFIFECRCARMCGSRVVASRSESCCRKRLAVYMSWWRACRSVGGPFRGVLRLLTPTLGRLEASALAKCGDVSSSTTPACPMDT